MPTPPAGPQGNQQAAAASTWKDKRDQIYEALNRLEKLEVQLKEVKLILDDVAATDPGGGPNIAG